MKHGNKFQQEKKQGFTKNIWLGFVVMGIVVFMITSFVTNYMDSSHKITIYDLLLDRRFVSVRTSMTSSSIPLRNFDLKNKNYFVNGTAIKDKVIYISSGKSFRSVEEAEERYNLRIHMDLTSAVFQLKVSKAEIKGQNYALVVDADKVLDEAYMMRGEIERLHEKNGLTKVRIRFNKEFLPVKIEGYYGKDGKSWHVLREFTYPYKTQEEFDKDMDEEIESILAGDYHSE